jgi:hypothetical protein
LWPKHRWCPRGFPRVCDCDPDRAVAALMASTPRGFALLASVFGRCWSAPAIVLLLVIALAQQQIIQCLVAVVVSVCLVERTPLHPLLRWRPLPSLE